LNPPNPPLGTPLEDFTPYKKKSDFRPISVTPFHEFLRNSLFVIISFLHCRMKLANQFAFRPTGSTTAALITFTHNVAELLEESPYVRCVFVDFSRAFDTVPHLDRSVIDQITSSLEERFTVNRAIILDTSYIPSSQWFKACNE